MRAILAAAIALSVLGGVSAVQMVQRGREVSAWAQEIPRRYIAPNAAMYPDDRAYAFLHEDWDYCTYGSAWADLIRARPHPPIYFQLKRQAAEMFVCSQSGGEEVVEVHPPNVPGFGLMGGVVIVFVVDRRITGPAATYWWIHRNALHTHDAAGNAVPFE